MENGKQPAYPTSNSDRGIEQGLTKREYFAGLAMQGICSNPSLESYSLQEKVQSSIAWADELLKQLEK